MLIVVIKTTKNLKEEIVDNDEILNFVDEIREDRTGEEIKKDPPDEIKKLEEDLNKMYGRK